MSRRATVSSVILGLAAGAMGGLYHAVFRRPLPQTAGVLRLSGLHHAAEIVRDQWGVPHIYAEELHDLFFAQGFVHAQDRFFQMEFGRRLGAGRLAEVVGPPAVEVDRWIRVIGLRRAAEKEMALLDAESRELLLAYANGVNAFIKHGKLPIEFSLLRYRPERWQVIDSLTWIKFMNWTLSVNWEAELARAQLIHDLGPERVANLETPYPRDTPTALSQEVDWSHIGEGALVRAESARPYTGPPAEAGLGSNSWVISGSRSKSGAPLLASDMHLGLVIPSIWYENHLCTDGYDVVGLSFPGLPGIIAGHNGHVAWSFTAGLTDTQDLYIERLNPENPHQYEYEGIWHDAQVLREEIAVKGAEPAIEEVVITRHGPLIDGLVPNEATEPTALCWTAYVPSNMVGALLKMNKARNCKEFHSSLKQWDGPVQNVVYADVEGNIGYTLVGNTPIRVKGHDGRVPVPGWTGEYEWQGYVPFEHWPHTINPPEGLIITANAKPVSDDYPYFLGHAWLPDFRANRITELLQNAKDVTAEDFCRMQFDLKSVLARRVGHHLARLRTTERPDVLDPIVALFRDWDGDLSPDSPTAAIYQVFIRRMLYNVFEEVTGDLPVKPSAAERFVGRGVHPVWAPTGLYGSYGQLLLASLLDASDSPTFSKRSQADVMAQSLREAIEYLEWHCGPQMNEWRWGSLHQLTYAHPLGQVKPLDRIFNRGPYPIGGDSTTVWATGAYYHNLDSERMVGPVCRFVVDLADLSHSRSLNAPGQSGQVGSRHYADRISDWFEGKYRPMIYHRHHVAKHAKSMLKVLP